MNLGIFDVFNLALTAFENLETFLSSFKLHFPGNQDSKLSLQVYVRFSIFTVCIYLWDFVNSCIPNELFDEISLPVHSKRLMNLRWNDIVQFTHRLWLRNHSIQGELLMLLLLWPMSEVMSYCMKWRETREEPFIQFLQLNLELYHKETKRQWYPEVKYFIWMDMDWVLECIKESRLHFTPQQ